MAKKRASHSSTEKLAAAIRVRRKQTAIEKTKVREAEWNVPTPEQDATSDELSRMTLPALRLTRDYMRAAEKMKQEDRWYKRDEEKQDEE